MSGKKTNPNRGRNIVLPIIVLVLLFACSFGLVAYKRTEAPATAAPAQVEAIAPTDVPTEAPVAEVVALQPLPDGVEVEKMSKCNDINQVGAWGDNKTPFAGTQLVCGADGYWDITLMFYNGVEYQLPVLENVVTEPAPEQLEVVTYIPTENAVPLVNEDETIGFFFVLNKVGPTEVLSPYQSTTLFALGNGTVGDTKVSSDGTEGNVVTLLCNVPDGCITEVKDYTPGHVGVTMILAGKEIPSETVLSAVVNLFNAPNCGGSGCKTNHHYQSGKKETFTTKPSAVKLDVPWKSITVLTAIVGEPPANAKVIKIDKKVVGHSYTCSGECSVSVPEGAGGTVACFSEGGTADGKAVNSGEIVSWNGADSDGGTPEDLNNTVLLNGNNIQIMMIYMADLEPFMNVACGQ